MAKVSYLEFRLEIPNDDYTEIDDKKEMKRVFEEFFREKVRHKFYCWKYIRGFINIFCTPIYRFIKPYELLNVELQQNTGQEITTIRKNDEYQRLLSKKKLYLEVLLQTLEVKKYDSNSSDVSFTVRFHDRATKDYADVLLMSNNRFQDIFLADKLTSNPIADIFQFMTMSVEEIKATTAPHENL